MRLRLIILSICVVGALLTVMPAAAVIGGEPDTEHAYVGLVASDNGQVCSGSLVSSRIFVTAGHCFAANGVQARVRFGASVSPSTPSTTGTAYVHPGFCLTCGTMYTDDLAVVKLDKAVSMSKYGSLPKAGVADSLVKHTEFAIVGYGASDFDGTQPVGAFSRLVATVELKKSKEAGDTHLTLSANSQGAACFGDSGGPNLLVGDTVLAITSFSQNSRCRGSTVSYRLDSAAARGFLDDFVKLP